MAGKKVFTSIEDMLSKSGESGATPYRAGPGGGPDDKKKSLGSIEDVMTTAEEEKKNSKKTYKTFASTLRSDDRNKPRQSAPTPSGLDDIFDELDYALDAVETAKKTVPHDKKAATALAVTLLLKSQKTSRSNAEDLINRAFKYIER